MSADNLEEYSIPQKYLKQLSELGLWYSPPMKCFGGGVWINKPVVAGGNSIPNYEPPGVIVIRYENEEAGPYLPQPDSDAPLVALYKDRSTDCWVVWGVGCSGGMGPADFVGLWTTLEDAIDDIADFYFGDSARMDLKAAYSLDPVGVTNKARLEGKMPKWPWSHG